MSTLLSNFLIKLNFYLRPRPWSSHSILNLSYSGKQKFIGREPWSSGYGRRLISLRLWFQIQAPFTVWTFFHLPICCKICNVCLKRRKKRPCLAHLKGSLGKSASYLVDRRPCVQFHKTLQIRKLWICSYGQILTINLLINCKNYVIYGKMTVNYKEKSFME